MFWRYAVYVVNIVEIYAVQATTIIVIVCYSHTVIKHLNSTAMYCIKLVIRCLNEHFETMT